MRKWVDPLNIFPDPAVLAIDGYNPAKMWPMHRPGLSSVHLVVRHGMVQAIWDPFGGVLHLGDDAVVERGEFVGVRQILWGQRSVLRDCLLELAPDADPLEVPDGCLLESSFIDGMNWARQRSLSLKNIGYCHFTDERKLLI